MLEFNTRINKDLLTWNYEMCSFIQPIVDFTYIANQLPFSLINTPHILRICMYTQFLNFCAYPYKNALLFIGSPPRHKHQTITGALNLTKFFYRYRDPVAIYERRLISGRWIRFTKAYCGYWIYNDIKVVNHILLWLVEIIEIKLKRKLNEHIFKC